MNPKDKRKANLKLNTATSLGYRVITIICNFILPRIILSAYGSNVNGLVNSIAQFLHIIGFLELGVGSVVQSALYKPLADRDEAAVSKIVVSAQRFFRKIACILLVYVGILILVFPFTAGQEYGWLYTALLIAAISISSFAQYYFGMVDSLLLLADQRGYVQYVAQAVTVILNTVACALLIYLGCGIHVVKLTTSILFLLRPLILRLYINRRYKIDRRIAFEGEPIQQKWNGMAQHVAAVVLDGTDTIVLTTFSTLANVSIYSVYHLVLFGVQNLFLSLTNGVKSLIGELWAKQELDTLKKTFGRFEWLLHTGTVFVYGCTGILILPFVQVYTSGVTDANYCQPLFAALITLAYAGHCLRLPYSVMILAGGHYKQTQNNYIIAAIINVVVSVATVVAFGLVGVAIGTLVAMLYQTIWMAWYVSKNLVKWPFKRFAKQMGVDLLTICLVVLATRWISLAAVSYFAWAWMAVQVAVVFGAISLLVNVVFYKDFLRIKFKK